MPTRRTVAQLLMATLAVAAARSRAAADDRRNADTATLVTATAITIGFVVQAAGDDDSTTELVGAALIATLPSAGHLYAGRPGIALATVSVRAAAVAAVFYGVDHTAPICISFPGCGDDDGAPQRRDDTGLGIGLIVVGATTLAGTLIYDLVQVRAEVRAHNRGLTIAPTALRDQRGQRAPGLALAATF